MEIQANTPKTIIGDYRKGEKKMLEKKTFTKEDKNDATEFAEILYKVQKLPTEQKIAMQSYIKGAVDIALLLGHQEKENNGELARKSI